jgi:quercetin dioxygenase-like cupin family protein
MSSRHVVRRTTDTGRTAEAPVPGSSGYTRWSHVDETVAGAVHTGFGTCALAPGGSVPTRVQSFEQSCYVLDGEVVLQTADGAWLLRPGDYALVPVGVAHSWRNEGPGTAQWADMLAPQPRARFGGDAITVPELPHTRPMPVDVRDPRTRRFGHVDAEAMDATKQNQERLAVSASMRTALLVYSGITVKMMVDSDLGADLSTMFMVQYDPDGVAGPHDHPFEETYLFLSGEVEAMFDGDVYRLGPGDAAFAGVGCVHAFRNLGTGPLRWLETQAPQPPGRHSYRFRRDWDYLEGTLTQEGSDD